MKNSWASSGLPMTWFASERLLCLLQMGINQIDAVVVLSALKIALWKRNVNSRSARFEFSFCNGFKLNKSFHMK